MTEIRTDAFYSCARALDAAADRMLGTWSSGLIRDMRAIAKLALEQDAALSKVMPDVREYIRSKAQANDGYVTREPDYDDAGCSCHISAPCSTCTRETDEVEA